MAYTREQVEEFKKSMFGRVSVNNMNMKMLATLIMDVHDKIVALEEKALLATKTTEEKVLLEAKTVDEKVTILEQKIAVLEGK